MGRGREGGREERERERRGERDERGGRGGKGRGKEREREEEGRKRRQEDRQIVSGRFFIKRTSLSPPPLPPPPQCCRLGFNLRLRQTDLPTAPLFHRTCGRGGILSLIFAGRGVKVNVATAFRKLLPLQDRRDGASRGEVEQANGEHFLNTADPNGVPWRRPATGLTSRAVKDICL